METYSDMTRPTGKLMKTTSIEELTNSNNRISPENTIKYKLYKQLKKMNKPILATELHKIVAPYSPRRSVEKRLFDLYNEGSIKREKCMCGCSFLYSV